MRTPLSDLLRERFAELRVGETRLAWAEALDVDKGTLSRVLNGLMALTEKRAHEWAQVLFNDDPVAATSFAEQMLAAARSIPRVARRAGSVPPGDRSSQSPPGLTIPDLFDKIVAEGGAVPAERIGDLFKLLPSVQNAILLIEYRDIPRAGPQARYQSLAVDLAQAVVNGLAVGMFMPFKLPEDGPSNEVHSKAQKLMEEVRDECRIAYRKFIKMAEGLAPNKTEEIKSLLKLYEPGPDYPETLGTGFQAKTFYLQYDTFGGEHAIRHHRILQWVATPTRDLLVYRGELMITPAALGDSFFPVPHYLETQISRGASVESLPELPLKGDQLQDVKAAWEGFGLPLDKRLWRSVDV